MRQALVLGITADLDFAAGAFLAGFLRHNAGFAGDVVVLHDGLGAQAQQALSRLAPRLRLEPFGPARARARLMQAGLDRPRIRRALARRNPMILAKFEMFDWLDRYDSVVWCDADMLVQAPVGDLWGAGLLGWRGLADGALARRGATLRAVEHLLTVHDVPLPNGGVIVAGADLRHRGLGARDLYAMVAQLVRHTRAEALDELALFLLASHHRLAVTALDPGLNQSVAMPGAAQARILHAIGPDKFWNAAPLRQSCPQWQADHDLWVAAGGRPAPAPDRLTDVHPMAPDAALAAARNRAFWQEFWRDLGPALPDGLWPDLRPDLPYLRLHLTGQDRHLWAELTPTATPGRIRLAVGLERTATADPAPLHRTLAASGLGLRYKDARAHHVWFTESPRDGLPAALALLRDALRAALTPTETPCPPP
ncbi:hypothetical protein [Gemmobacter sp.]|uniref:hypothetical protein n=1 Tax=Gemmobacter sp. TaxID=1898957 RepID=UPI002B002625|nr:hypothetical protein [Gemmobacter sp.]